MSQKETQASYAQDIERIQKLIELLGQKECDIDKMIEYVKEATEIIARCQSKLVKTGIDVEEALKKLESMNNN